jgi:hypothetical protein
MAVWYVVLKYPNKKTTYNCICKWLYCWWAHLGSNQGPTDYESATLTN